MRTLDIQENKQREIIEKKKAEQERLKAEKERLKQEAKRAQQGKDATSKKIPEPQEDIVDALLQEIRAGDSLRTITNDSGHRPNRCTLKKEDIEKLEQMSEEKKEDTEKFEQTNEEKKEGIKNPEQMNEEKKEDIQKLEQMSKEKEQMSQEKKENKTMVVEDLEQQVNGIEQSYMLWILQTYSSMCHV